MEIDKVIKQSKFTDGYQKAVINLFYTSNFFRDAHLTVFNEYKIQSQHFNVLRILKGKHPETVSPGYIKEVMLDKGCDLTRLIDKLQSLGFVHRFVSPDNKRKMNIALTENGLLQLEKISISFDEKNKELKCLSEDDYQLLSNLLDKMRNCH
jgi:DNA-binding MarR family transcriptional regulator